MAHTDASLCSAALLKLGARPIERLDQPDAEARVAATLYPLTRDATLASHPWGFATKRAALAPRGETAGGEFRRAFALPADFLAPISVGGARFAVAGETIETDAEAATLAYVARVEERRFPSHFAEALVARLAAEFCLPLTENTDRAEALRRHAELAFVAAKRVDRQRDVLPVVEDYSLIRARRS